MQDNIHTLACAMARVGIDNIALPEFMPPPLFFADRKAQLLKVLTITGLEVVQAHDILSQAQQRLDQMGADEACAAGHQPAHRLGP